jgi:adenylate cyclase
MQPQQCTITVLFSDIRGFTTLSEKSSPDEVVALLNAYFARQVDVIFAHGGTLDKFIGDAIMAFWGAPIAQHDQADRALAAAVEMQKVKDEFVASLPPHLRHFDVGIGLHTGPAVVGMVGSDRRVDYTAIGDTVNLASRIEGLTKSLAPLLFSDATRAALTGQWACRSVGSTQVKGREKPVSLFTLSGDGAIPDIPAMKHEEG